MGIKIGGPPTKTQRLRLVVLSDTHNRHKQLTIPDGDVLIHCGDFSAMGRHTETKNFFKWFSKQPHNLKLVIAGNHDLSFEREPEFKQEMLKWIDEESDGIFYLEDSGIIYGGVTFYGSPWQPEFCNWAFNLPRGGKELKEKWAAIPQNTDVLITHGGPKGILDRCQHPSPGYPEEAGCKHLLSRIQYVQPKYHFFGHVHEGYGSNHWALERTTCINASSCDLGYNPVNKPVVVEI